MRQIELVRAALATGTPLFGSCWGLQVITAAAGGSVRKNPKGREIGFGRGIRLTEAGRKHPMYVGKLDVFNAPTVHLDEVEALPAGTTVLATNAMSDVQSVEIRTNGSVAWGVQYHPEYPLREIAAIVRRIGTRLIERRLLRRRATTSRPSRRISTRSTAIPHCKRLSWRHGISKNVLDKKLRVSEVANWIEFQVLPTRVKRGGLAHAQACPDVDRGWNLSGQDQPGKMHGFFRQACRGHRRHRRARHRGGRRDCWRPARPAPFPMCTKPRRSAFPIAAIRT